MFSETVIIGDKTYFVDPQWYSKPGATLKCDEMNMKLVAFEEQKEYADVTGWLVNNGTNAYFF